MEMTYAHCGNSGLQLPRISLGLWQGFGSDGDPRRQHEILGFAIESGISHIDLANNYGPPAGSAERMLGEFLEAVGGSVRDQLVISTKAGYRMWPGPSGEGSSRKHLLASLDQSLARLGLDYVDIFYSHRFDQYTPLEETMAALKTAVDSGRALYAGISSYSAVRTRQALAAAERVGLTLTIHQPAYSMVNRWIEKPDTRTADSASLLDVVAEAGLGLIVFSPLAQGLLTDKYLSGIPAGSRAARDASFKSAFVTYEVVKHLRALNDIAAKRDLTLAQLALLWAGRDKRVTSLLVGTSSVDQLRANLQVLAAEPLSADECAAIEEHAVDAGVNIWGPRSSDL